MLSASNISNYTELIIAREKSTSTLTGSIALLNNVVAGFLILPRQKVMVTVVFELVIISATGVVGHPSFRKARA